jgi:hypothetical protein
MKKYFIIAWILFLVFSNISGQNICNSGRYQSNVYPTIDSVLGIKYGWNRNYAGTMDTLTLDIRQPSADTCNARPLIIWAHGGSFVFGTSQDVDMVSLSHRFAEKGFVCASINYRLGISSFDSTGAILALLRAEQDMKAAIRFFYKDKRTTNTYKIDTNNIFIGGSSAGAITALHVAYLKRDCQIVDPGYIADTSLASMGGLEGVSGNAGYSDKVRACISLSGALGRYYWMETGDIPLCAMHGTADSVVLYNRGIVNPGIPLLYMDGARMLYAQSKTVGVADSFYTWYGAGHIPFYGTTVSDLAYMDTTEHFIRDFLIRQLGCTNPPLQASDAPYGTANLYPGTNCPLGVPTVNNHSLNAKVYPVPSSSSVTIDMEEEKPPYYLEVIDLSGKILLSDYVENNTYILNKKQFGTGVYFLKISNTKGNTAIKKIAFY